MLLVSNPGQQPTLSWPPPRRPRRKLSPRGERIVGWLVSILFVLLLGVLYVTDPVGFRRDLIDPPLRWATVVFFVFFSIVSDAWSDLRGWLRTPTAPVIVVAVMFAWIAAAALERSLAELRQRLDALERRIDALEIPESGGSRRESAVEE